MPLTRILADPVFAPMVEGYRRYRENVWPERRAAYQALARDGQAPMAAIIACADSRVDPSAIFQAAPGELFIIRNVANLVPPYQPDAAYHGTSAALEFAVRALAVPVLLVMGHRQCGGVRALMDGAPDGLGDFLLPWMQIAAPARERALACTDPATDRLTVAEHETVKLSIANLMGFPWVAEAVRSGTLALRGAYYGIATGTLELLGADGEFHPVR